MSRQVMTLTVTGLKEFDNALKMMGDGKNTYKVIRKEWTREAKQNVSPRVQRHVRGVFRGKKTLAKSVITKVQGTSINDVRMIVYSHAPPMAAHEFGATIRPKTGKYLTVPTDFTKGTSLRTIAENGVKIPRRIRTRFKASFLKKAEGTFLLEREGRHPVIMQKIKQERGSKLRKKQISRINRAGKRVRDVGMAIPLFTLIPNLHLPRRTWIRTIVKRMVPGIAKNTASALKKEFFKSYAPGSRVIK